MANHEGQQLGNYRLLGSLGHGGFGEVYLGKHVLLENFAAIKVLHAHWTGVGKEDFLIEAKRLMGLNHSNIVRVLDFGVQGDTSYLIMEYAPNGSLKDHHDATSSFPLPLPVSTVVSYVQQIASALQYLHDQKLIHRDVKPANILLGANGSLLLSDMGLTVIAHSEASFSLQTESGTPLYMAPEQSKGRSVLASDQYTLGVVAYEWLCGIPPFTSTSKGLALQKDLREQHLYASPPSLRLRSPLISPRVEAVVLKALAKDPHERFPKIQAFAEALTQASQPVSTIQLAPSVKPLPPEKQAPSPTLTISLPRQSASFSNVAIAASQSSLPTDPVSQAGLTSSSLQLMKQPESTIAAVHESLGKRVEKVQASTMTPYHPRQKTRVHRWQVIVLTFIVSLLILEGVGYASVRSGFLAKKGPVAISSALIAITPVSKDLKKSYTISAVTGTPDAAQHQVQARWLSVPTQPQSKTVNATGTGTTPGTHATGTLKFSLYIPHGPRTTIPAGTVFVGKSGIQVVTDQDIFVSPDGSGAAHAVQPGGSGNIPIHDMDQSYYEGSVEVLVSNDVAFTGGQDAQTYVVVQQSDINSAANSLETTNAPNAQQVLQAQVHANEQLIRSPQCDPNVTSDHTAGDKATSVTVTVTYTCTGEVYDHRGALAMAEHWLKQDASTNPGTGYGLVGNIVTTLTQAQVSDTSQGTVTVSVTAEGVWAFQFGDVQKLAPVKLIAGKKKEAAQILPSQQPGVAHVSITLSSGDRETFPADLSKINIVVLSVQGIST
jgi:serine/threonine protein kinase